MNDALKEVVFEELTDASRRTEGGGGFLPAVPKLPFLFNSSGKTISQCGRLTRDCKRLLWDA